jgi:hypothetical protein
MLYRLVRNAIMVRGGLQPRGVYWWSKDGNTFQPAREPRLKMPNLVGSFHEALRCFWDQHVFGARCLLVSESRKTAEAMRKHYPATRFVSCDLFEVHSTEGTICVCYRRA